jgi:hypothetical protein
MTWGARDDQARNMDMIKIKSDSMGFTAMGYTLNGYNI